MTSPPVYPAVGTPVPTNTVPRVRLGGVPLLPPTAAYSARGALPSPAVVAPPLSASQRLPSLTGEGLVLLRQHTSNLLMHVTPTAAVVQTFCCAICFENVRVEDRIIFAACGNPSHACCRECMRQYVRGLVTDGKVDAIQCPQSKECGGKASEGEVRMLTDPDTFAKFKRFQLMQMDPDLRQCPTCGRLVKPEVDEDGSIVAEMECPCGAEFCYYHSNAHVGRPCEEYRKTVAKEERLAMDGALKGTKPCPNCGIITEKISGCNHMTCATCRTHWCWICGQSFENISWHYNPGNLNGCLQFQDSESETSTMLFRCLRLLMLPVVAVSLLLFFVCSLLLIVWLFVALFTVGPLTCFNSHAIFGCAATCAYLPMVLFQMVWVCVSFLFYTLFLPCGATQDHLLFLLQVPMASVVGLLEGALH